MPNCRWRLNVSTFLRAPVETSTRLIEPIRIPSKPLAIINEPLLILADEPTGNLDPETGEEIINILKKINSRGTAVLCATHNYDLVKKVDSKIIKLSNGTATQVVLKSKN